MELVIAAALVAAGLIVAATLHARAAGEIGRASCRERG